MSRHRVVLLLLSMAVAMLWVDVLSVPRTLSLQGAMQVHDAITRLTEHRGQRRLVVLAPAGNIGLECEQVPALCERLAASTGLRPTLWIRKVSLFGDHLAVRAVVQGEEVLSPDAQMAALDAHRHRKLFTALLCSAVLLVVFLFPVLARPRFEKRPSRGLER